MFSSPNPKPSSYILSPITTLSPDQKSSLDAELQTFLQSGKSKDELKYFLLQIQQHISTNIDLVMDKDNTFMKFSDDFINANIITDTVNKRDNFLSGIRDSSRDKGHYMECLVSYLIVMNGFHGAVKGGQKTFRSQSFAKSITEKDAPSWNDIQGKVLKVTNDKGVDLVILSGSGTALHVAYIQVKHGKKHGYTDFTKTNKFALSTIRYRLRAGRYDIQSMIERWFPNRFASYTYEYHLYTTAIVIPAITKDAKKIRAPPGGTEVVIHNRSDIWNCVQGLGVQEALGVNNLGIFNGDL